MLELLLYCLTLLLSFSALLVHSSLLFFLALYSFCLTLALESIKLLAERRADMLFARLILCEQAPAEVLKELALYLDSCKKVYITSLAAALLLVFLLFARCCSAELLLALGFPLIVYCLYAHYFTQEIKKSISIEGNKLRLARRVKKEIVEQLRQKV
ncbi:MAG: hypothetical protein GXO42_02615 [bacterium]|nr:hypothetical protein [bacterium]